MNEKAKPDSKNKAHLGDTFIALAMAFMGVALLFAVSVAPSACLSAFVIFIFAVITSWKAFFRNKTHKQAKWFFQFPVALICTILPLGLVWILCIAMFR